MNRMFPMYNRIIIGGSIIALLFLVAGAAFAGTPPQRGRCHDEFCLWEEVVHKSLVKSEKGAELYQVDYLEYQTMHNVKKTAGGAGVYATYPEEFDSKYEQATAPVKKSAYVFCYPKLPVVISTLPRVLHLDGDIVTYAEANSAAIYVATCHDTSIVSFFKGDFRSKRGYIPPHLDSITITQPADVFNYISANP